MVQDLLPLVLERGFGTVILMSDDARTIELWGGEVLALREAVERERRAGVSGVATRRHRLLAAGTG